MFWGLYLLLSELNRFTINSINHNHYDDNDRQAFRDDTNVIASYWLRSAASGHDHTIDALLRPVAFVWTAGYRSAGNANSTFFGFRPIL